MREQILVYAFLAVAGMLAGFIRFLRSKQKWDLRYVIASSLTGGLMAMVPIGYYWGNKAVDNPWGCMALALCIGFVQPDLSLMLNTLLRNKGINITMEKGS